MGFARALLFGFLTWVGGALAGEVGVTDNSLLIGMTAPFSGPNGAYGLDMKMVINAYFRQLNAAGGIHGRRLELRALDDGYETERAVANTRALIGQEKVFALLASYGSSPTTAAMNEVFGVAKVPLIGTISGAESLRQSPGENPNNRYMFNVRASYANETEAIVNQLASLGFKNIAVLYQNDGFGKSGLEGVVAALKKHAQAPSAVATVERNSVDVGQAVNFVIHFSGGRVDESQRLPEVLEPIGLLQMMSMHEHSHKIIFIIFQSSNKEDNSLQQHLVYYIILFLLVMNQHDLISFLSQYLE